MIMEDTLFEIESGYQQETVERRYLPDGNRLPYRQLGHGEGGFTGLGGGDETAIVAKARALHAASCLQITIGQASPSGRQIGPQLKPFFGAANAC